MFILYRSKVFSVLSRFLIYNNRGYSFTSEIVRFVDITENLIDKDNNKITGRADIV